MTRRQFLRWTSLAAAAVATRAGRRAAAAGADRPNVLLLTVDDMNCDSVGAFGCRLPDTTPNIDRLAGQGLRFKHAHVQVANCMPCRNVMQSGLYSHTNGVEGFFQVRHDRPLLPGVLKEHGYFVGIKNKVRHSTPYSPWPWDMAEEAGGQGGKRNPKDFKDFTARAIAAARQAHKPFYLVVNVNDPHKPFFVEGRDGRGARGGHPPSKTFPQKDIPIPGFLPDLPGVQAELKQYYDSVRRGDDCAGAALEALDASGQADNTLVMFLSDHGMPFPFAKTNIYHHSTHTPWICRWPRKIKPGTTDAKHMISTVDIMPTVLDAAGIDPPEALQGASFLPALLGREQTGLDHVIKEYNENAGGGRHPMRGVQTRKYLYTFNPWASGRRKFRGAAQGTRTYKAMVAAAKTDEKVAARLREFDYRSLEQFFDVANDPDCLEDLIDDPAHADELARHRKLLEAWMVRTADPWLEGFRNREKPEVLEARMRAEQQASHERRKSRRNKGKQKGKRSGLIELVPPKAPAAGEKVTVTVRHTLPADLGEQPCHVTLKDGKRKRLDRKVLPIEGKGELDVTFDLPADRNLQAVHFAAFVGSDYPNCLQHTHTDPIRLR